MESKRIQQTSEYNKKETDSWITENKPGERKERKGNMGVGD